MYLKTTNTQFLQYGTIANDKTTFNRERHLYATKNQQIFRYYDYPVSIQVIEGIALLTLLDEQQAIHEFVLHRRAILDKNIPFMILPLTKSALVEEAVETNNTYQEQHCESPHAIIHHAIQPQFYISDIFSYYYSVKGQDYNFSGEKHDYWEITYVDTGEIVLNIDQHDFKLSSQDLMIYLPGQFHRQHIEPSKACSYLTIMFDMSIKEADAKILGNKVFHCSQPMYQLISNFIKNTNELETQSLPYAGDLMISYLQELIIMMIQYENQPTPYNSMINPAQHQFESEMIDEMSKYILQEIHNPISVEDICNHFGVSRSTLQTLFKKYLAIPPKQYINNLKMQEAKRMLTQENVSITEIALRLGFSSIHYFSRKFKQEFGISPREFSQSVFKDEL